MISNIKQQEITRHLHGYPDTYSVTFQYEGETYQASFQGGDKYWKRLTNILEGDKYDHAYGGTFFHPPFYHGTPEGQAAIEMLRKASGQPDPAPAVIL